MLRLIALALVLANAGYYAWSHHWLRVWGLATTEEAEPQRIAQQIRPSGFKILRTGITEAPAAPAPTALAAPVSVVPIPIPVPVPVASIPLPPAVVPVAPPLCLQAGVFDAAQAETLRRTLSGKLPVGSWSLGNTTLPGRWMVYMGRFTDNETLNKKRNELRARNVSFDRPGIAALEPGLALGHFSSEDAADRALVALAKRGVRSARVVQEREQMAGFILRLPAVNAEMNTQLYAMRRVLAGKNLRPCP